MEYEDLQLNLRFSLIFLAILLAAFTVGIWLGLGSRRRSELAKPPEKPEKPAPENPAK
jgi:uncharacterized protein (UPF0333 family)